MRQEKAARHAGALVVPGHPEDVDSRVRELREACEDPLGEPRGDAAPVEEVAAVNDDVGLSRRRGKERPLEALEEVVAAPRPLDPRPRGEVEAEMSVGKEEDANGHAESVT